MRRAERTPMALQAGELVGPYQIEGQLGAGGMATVYKAYHPKLDRHVAIKVMHQALLTDAAFQGRFEREARIVARLEHPNIVPIYDFSEYQGQPYLVMKFIEGRTLKQVAREYDGQVPLDIIRRVIGRIAAALSYAHARGVLHRDIKPSNIVIAPDGTPYLTDFGLARIAQSGESTMSADQMIGTPNYMSPEQARGERDLDARADIYSLGVVLYELLTGRVPFAADTPYSTVHDHIYTPPPPPRSLNPEISPAVEAVLLRALAKNPADRYDSAEALAADFEAALDGGSVVGESGERAAPVTEPARPQPRIPAGPPPGARIPSAGPPRPPAPPAPPTNRFESFGEAMERFGENMERMGEEASAAMERAFDPSGSAPASNRADWKPGTRYYDGPEGRGFYTSEEIEAFEAGEYEVDDEARLRKQVKKRMEERNGLIGHGVAFAMVNLMMWGIWLFSSIDSGDFNFPWPMFVTFGWGIGMVSHVMSYWSEYGGGRERREAYIQREMARLRGEAPPKAKRDAGDSALYADDEWSDGRAARVRLTEDGELTDSTVEDIEAASKRKRR